MKRSRTFGQRIWMLASCAAILLGATLAQAQNFPHLFRQPPVATQPGPHGMIARMGDIDDALLTSGPPNMTIVVPGKPDLLLNRDQHERRGARSMVWRGHGQSDPSAKVTLTLHEGILFGHIQSGNEIYSIHPAANGRTVIEKIDSDSYPPEWGHDKATHGHEMVPPKSDDTSTQSSTGTTTPTTAAAGSTTEIVLMSVYTPQARAAAGGTTQIQAQIQAAVDQANSAFMNSNMIARYFLAHTEEVTYNDSGDIATDLNWVTGNAGVASLRNTYSADMVSLITANGGGYCGIGWVQRSPGSGFAGYAFQVSAQGCLTNQTLAHEHGHNMGMEHDPADAGVASTGASYPWSFGHYVDGQFRTIMSYPNPCSLGCPRVLNFSNPNVLYNGIPTGIVNQRNNAYTGDLTAPIVAAFRSGGGSGTNSPPLFTSNPIIKPNAMQGQAYSATLSGSATDPNGDSLTFAKTAGPAWLSVGANGALSGTPTASDLGLNSFSVTVSDGRGGSATATLQITVDAPLAAPTNLTISFSFWRQFDLALQDSSNFERGIAIERSEDNGYLKCVAAMVPT